MKTCSNCKKRKTIKEFYNHKKQPRATCKLCRSGSIKYWRKHAKKYSVMGKKWRKRNSEKVIGYHLQQRYGISHKQFVLLSKKQRGRCAMCACKPSRLCVDHDHETGKIRGLLCKSCNLSLGLIKDSVETLQRAIYYLTPIAA